MTLSLLGAISSVLINFVNSVLPLLIVILLVCSAAACAVVVRGNNVVKDLIWQGWTPLFGAMVISCGTGIVLDMFASRYPGFPLLAVVISGKYCSPSAPQTTEFFQDYLGVWGLYLSRVYQLLYTLLHHIYLLLVILGLRRGSSWSRLVS